MSSSRGLMNQLNWIEHKYVQTELSEFTNGIRTGFLVDS